MLFIIILALPLNLMAQNIDSVNSQYDHINRDNFYILKADSNLSSLIKIKVSGLKSIKAAVQLFGSDYSSKKYFDKFFNRNTNIITYHDGLWLEIMEDPRNEINFKLTSDKYIILLSSGKVIKVGMTGDELKLIFPNSFSNRKVIVDRKDWYGKVTFNVYFSFVRDNKVYQEGAYIVFVLSKENGVLEQIISWEPG